MRGPNKAGLLQCFCIWTQRLANFSYATTQSSLLGGNFFFGKLSLVPNWLLAKNGFHHRSFHRVSPLVFSHGVISRHAFRVDITVKPSALGSADISRGAGVRQTVPIYTSIFKVEVQKKTPGSGRIACTSWYSLPRRTISFLDACMVRYF